MLLNRVRQDLAFRGIGEPQIHDIADAVRRAQEVPHAGNPDSAEPATGGLRAGVEAIEEITHGMSGLGPLASALRDEAVTDVVLNGDGSVWVDRGYGMVPAPVPRLTGEQARESAVRLAAIAGVRLDEAQPFADGVVVDRPGLPGAMRLRIHAVLSPPAAGGACISVRVLASKTHTLDTLEQRGFMEKPLTEVLRAIIAAQRNVLICGGTGAGKTTLLAAMLREVTPSERIVIVEDTPELDIDHPHVVMLTTRRPNAEGAGEISMTDLLKQCLRMRPDRIVVGEIRGAEVADLLVALNTGHDGSAGTVHANHPEAIPGRLEALAAMAGVGQRALVRQAADGIDVIIHADRSPSGQRRLTHLARLQRRRDELEVVTVWDGTPRLGWKDFCVEVGVA